MGGAWVSEGSMKQSHCISCGLPTSWLSWVFEFLFFCSVFLPAEHFWCCWLSVVSTFRGGVIKRGCGTVLKESQRWSLEESRHWPGTGSHCAGSFLSPALGTQGHCSSAALVSAASRHWSSLHILLPLELESMAPRHLVCLLGRSVSCAGKCWVGRVLVVANVTAYLWQVLFCFNFKRWWVQICCDTWQPSTALDQSYFWNGEAMSPNMFCKINDRQAQK